MAWQAASILFPDVEVELVLAMQALLSARGEDVYVDQRVPKPRHPRMVIFIRDGGAGSNFRDIARVRVLVWDQTFEKARTLARLVVALMPQIVNGAPFLKVEHQSGPYEVADDSKQSQMYLLFDVHTRGQAL